MNTDDASKLIWSNVPMNANGSSFACILNNTYTSPNYTMNGIEVKINNLVVNSISVFNADIITCSGKSFIEN